MAVPTRPPGAWRPDIQGLRALAVLVVVAFHAGLPVPGGFVGVDVFFVISGFVITAMLNREWSKSGRLDFGNFYIRRFKRLTPALAFMIAVTLVASFFILSPLGSQQTAVGTAVGAVFLCANFVIGRTTGGYFDLPAHLNPLLHTWSLSVEEQFYLIFPSLLALGWYAANRWKKLRSATYVIVAVVAALSFSLTLTSGISAVWNFYSPFTRAWEFAAGSLVFLSTLKLVPIRRVGVVTVIGAVGLVLVTFSLWAITESTRFPGPWALLPVVGTALMIFAGSQCPNPLSRVLSSNVAVKIGDWSYSIYLWHWPFIVFASQLWPSDKRATLLAAAFSVVPALISYRRLEQPMRNLQLGRGRWLATAVAATCAPPLVLALTIASLPKLGWGPASSSEFKAWRSTLAETHAPVTRGCFSHGPYNQEYIDRCSWNGTDSGGPLYLVGDSNAMQFSEALIRSASSASSPEFNHPLSIMTAPSCPMIEGLRIKVLGESSYFPGVLPWNEFEHCATYIDAAAAWLKRAHPGTVFIASLDQYWWDDGVGVAINGGEITGDAAAKLAVLRNGLTATVKALQAVGHRVVLVQAIPTYRRPTPIWDPRTCTYRELSSHRCGRKVAVDVLDAFQGPPRKAVADVAAATGAEIIDLRGKLCDAGECSTQRDGLPWYMDATHLNVAASNALADSFARSANR